MPPLNKTRYKTLAIELYKSGLKCYYVAQKLGMHQNTFYRKMRGAKTSFSIDEAVKMREILGVDMPIEKLFEVSDS